MVDTNKLTRLQIAIINAMITSAIVFVAMVITTDLPMTQNLLTASVGFLLAMLVQELLKMLISKDGALTPPKIGMLI